MLKWLTNVAEAIEALFVVVLGTALFLGVFVAAPALLVRELVATARNGLAALVVGCSLLAIAALCRDLIRKRWSIVSRFVVGGWFLCLGVVFVLLNVA